MNELALELLKFFYDRNETLQEDFAAFAETEEYKQFMEEQGYSDLIGWLTHKRWKVCQTCGRPFISEDDKNRVKYCRYEVYRKHKSTGEPFAATELGRSVCYMEARRTRRYNYKERKKVNGA